MVREGHSGIFTGNLNLAALQKAGKEKAMSSIPDTRRLQEEIDSLHASLQRLTQRVYALEHPPGISHQGVPDAVSAPPVPDEPVPPAREPVAAQPDSLVAQFSFAADLQRLHAGSSPASRAVSPEWEALVGGSWLNKAGVLVLVIGLALFLWYSFGQMGPWGREAVACGISLSMLGGGAALEPRQRYRTAARGLVGGGWVALYSAVYAAHAVEAARIISSPVMATLLLAAVAVGMIVHSLHYKSQTVTGLSYFAAFVTLAISPIAAFALSGLALLAVSLMYLAHRFRWSGAAFAGLLATYGVYAIQAARSSGSSLAVGQSVLFVYWLVFEWFDVQNAAHAKRDATRPCPLLPLNASGFLAVSIIQWQASSPGNLYLFFVISAAAYLASSVLRLAFVPVSGFSQGAGVLERVKNGSFEGALTLAAGLSAVAIALKLSGLSVSVAFLIEAELLFFAGLYGKQQFLGRLAAALLGVSVMRMLALDTRWPKQAGWAEIAYYPWSPVGLLHVAVFYLNRFLADRSAYYSHAAAGLLMLVLAFEFPPAFIGLMWVVLALTLYEFGIRLHLLDFTVGSLWVGALSLLMFLGRNVLIAGSNVDWHEWAPQLLGGLLLYGVTLRPCLPDLACRITSAGGTVLLAAFLSSILRPSFMTVAWGAQGVASLLAGFPLRQRWLRLSGLALLILCVLKLFVYDLRTLELPFRILSFLVLGVILIGVSFIYSRFRERISKYL
jgi:uncharacterized membrane protein